LIYIHVAPHRYYIAFRYAEPFTQDAIHQMKKDGVRRGIAFPQYPQFSCTTTGSSLNELRRALQSVDPERSISWSVIDRWSLHSTVLNAFASIIRDTLNSFEKEKRDRVLILFTAHSLPLAVVERGDTYAAEVCATAHAVMQVLKLENPFRIVWQSQVGPARWLSPQTRDVIGMLAKKFKEGSNAYSGIILVPIAFTSDHIETLYELDHEYVENVAEKLAGCPKGMVLRAPALNTRPEFIHAMAKIVQEHLARFGSKNDSSNTALSQYRVPCHNCIESDCLESRHFYLGHEHQITSA
jgi:protoporphyrin/coproporphyrin ferrochelatase